MTLDRKNKILIGLGVVAAILLVKLFSIQILDQQMTNFTQLPANDENQPPASEDGADH